MKKVDRILWFNFGFNVLFTVVTLFAFTNAIKDIIKTNDVLLDKSADIANNDIVGQNSSDDTTTVYITTTPAGPYFDESVHQNISISALLGKTAYLTCKVNNLGNKTVSWVRHRDVHLLTVGRYTYTSDDRFRAINGPNTNEWTLQIKYPQLRDAGTYECQISTTPHLSRIYHLNVVEPKAKILGGSELYIDHGSTINLTCLIIGGLDPQGYVFWYHNNRIINENSPRGGVKIVTETGIKSKSVLLIHNARPTDSGRYECNPTNAHYKSVQIHVLNGNNPEAMQHNVGSHSFNTVSSYFNLFLLNIPSIILIKCLKYIS